MGWHSQTSPILLCFTQMVRTMNTALIRLPTLFLACVLVTAAGASAASPVSPVNQVNQVNPVSQALSQADDYTFDDNPRPSAAELPDWFKQSFLDLREDLKETVKAGKQGIMVYFGQDHCAYCHRLLQVNFGLEDIAGYTRFRPLPVACSSTIWPGRISPPNPASTSMSLPSMPGGHGRFGCWTALE